MNNEEKIKMHKDRLSSINNGIAELEFNVKDMKAKGFNRGLFLDATFKHDNMEVLVELEDKLFDFGYYPKFPLNFKASIEKTHNIMWVNLIIEH